jgi:hypothetical protein
MFRKDRFFRLGVLSAALAATVTGCSDPVEPPPDGLFGVWEWVRAEGGVGGVTLTPATEGYTLQLRISRPDRIQLDRDGVAQIVTSFEMTSPLGTDRLRYGEPVLGQPDHQLYFSDGMLVLTDPCCDGFTWTWAPRLE